MNSASREALWRRLCDAGLAAGDVPAPSASPAPWYVRTMLGVAGWIGALFLLGFVGAAMSFVFETETVGLVVGAACCAAAFAIFRAAPHNDLAAQFALAVSLAGQVLFMFGVSGLVGNSSANPTFFFAIAIFEAALAATIPNFVHRVWSSFASAVAFGYAFDLIGLPGVTGVVAAALAGLWLAEPQWLSQSALWRPIGFGMAFSLLQFDIVPILGSGFLVHRPGDVPAFWVIWSGPVLVAGVLIYAVNRLLARHGETPGSRTGMAVLAGSVAIAAATLNAPGVASSLLILLLGFAGGNRTLFGVGVAGMLGYLSYFYYSLEATLLAKSAALGGTGLVLIALWAATRWLFGPAPVKIRETTHA